MSFKSLKICLNVSKHKHTTYSIAGMCFRENGSELKKKKI